MFQHNLLLIYRNFKRFRSTFIINLVGLSTGLTCTLLIYLWVNDELNMDKFHTKDDQLFQVMLHHAESNRIHTAGDTPALMAEAMEEALPEVEMAVEDTDPSWFGESFIISDGDVNLKMRGKFSGKEYFEIFSFDLIHGDKKQVLDDKNAIVISEKLARTLFNSTENAIGKSLEWKLLNFKYPAIVSGVFKDIPVNSSKQFDFVLSFQTFEEILGKQRIHWGNYNALTFVTLRKHTSAEAFNKKITDFIKTKAPSSNVTVFVKPFSENYLFGKYENGVQTGGRIAYVRLFSIIALFILIIACINFMNLSTAKASRRVKEIGIKKAIGANRGTLIYQYLGESMLMAFLSLLLAILLVDLSLAQFNLITGKHLRLQFDGKLMLSLFGITLFTGLLAGSYPALYLSGFKPAVVLKGKLAGSVGEYWARRGLVVFQFALSVILIVSVLVVYKQIQFIQAKNLGYDKEQLIYFGKDGKLAENLEAFLAEARKVPGVVNASAIDHSLVQSGSYTTDIGWEGKTAEDIIRFENASVTYGLIETLGIDMVAGRTFSRDFGTDSLRAIVFNEAAIEAMGLADAVGKTVKLWGQDRQIIGVAKNFHFESLHENVKPLFFKITPRNTTNIMVKLSAGLEKETIEKLRKLYQKFNPGFAFDYMFLDQNYQNQYVAEQRVSVLSSYFAGLAILISCMGLFGLAAFTAERRLKEVGIRKVLGSSELSIVYLLSAEFTKIILLSIVIALPLSYIIIAYWLDNFAYKIELEWWYFFTAGSLALIIAWLTVGGHALKAARINPTQCLKDE